MKKFLLVFALLTSPLVHSDESSNELIDTCTEISEFVFQFSYARNVGADTRSVIDNRPEFITEEGVSRWLRPVLEKPLVQSDAMTASYVDYLETEVKCLKNTVVMLFDYI